jgi:type 2 lantibiotic biosynthesis protein LanM
VSSVERLDIASAPASAYLHERVADSPAGGWPVSGRIEDWRASAYLDERVFGIRLRRLGLTEESFDRLLGDGVFHVADGVLDWVVELAEVLEEDVSGVIGIELSTKLWSQSFQRLLFGGLLHRFLAYYDRRLREYLPGIPDAAKIRRSLLETLANRLLVVCARTLLLELNVARVHGRLVGDTPERRYDYYDRVMLADPAYLSALFDEYPVLGRCMVECGRRWVSYVAELFRRLADDTRALRAAGLLPTVDSRLSAVRLDLGDPHDGGRAVARLTFDDGTDIVYKPRPVGAERAYAETVAALNGLGLTVPVVAPRVLDCGTYGWCEFVRPAPCDDTRAVGDFYRRAGVVLAAMLLLGGVDMHMENVIAAGSSFTPIDLETLLQPGIPSGEVTDAYGRALELLNQSVLAIGILPARAFGGRQRKSVDVSAIGGGQPQSTPRPVPQVVDPYTDVARIEAVEAMMAGAQNRPVVIGGGEVRAAEYTESVVAGFAEAYDIMTANREVFARMLAGFGDVEVRYLPRPTRRYSIFLTESYHPDYLRDARQRDRLLDKLWTAADARPDLIPVIESERRQLLAGDIPCFRVVAGSRGIRAGGEVLHAEYFDAPGTTVLAARLAGFGPTHRAAQIRIIRDAMETIPVPRPVTGSSASSHDDVDGFTPDIAAGLAKKIANRLADEAILGTDDAVWIGVSIEGIDQDAYSYKPLATGLYDGVAGLALANAYAARHFGDERFLDLARRTAGPVVGYLRYLAKHRIVETVGAYSGISGLLYTLDHVAHVLDDSSYLEAIDEALPWLRRCAEQEDCPDLIAGLAGCAIVALGLYRRHGMAGYREVAAVCGERLLASAVDVQGTAGWYVTHSGAMLGGFSHGSAGIAWSLHELADEFDDAALRDVADRAVAFDRRLYVPAAGAWRDLRPEMAGTESYPALWCHGAGGIGLSRLLMLQRHGDEALAEEARAAVDLVAAHGFGHNHSICHGDFGALALLELAEQTWGKPVGHAGRAGAVIRDIAAKGLRCGLTDGIWMPGLMLGAAGALLGLLRLASPSDVPEVAWLQPPR